MKNPLPLRVAFAEDFPLFYEHLQASFTDWGYEIVAMAEDGVELINQLEKAIALPDVCTLDLRMPHLDGFDTARLIRQKWPSIKLIAFSTDAEKNSDRITACGFHSFLQKGRHPLDLKTEIERVCNPYAII